MLNDIVDVPKVPPDPTGRPLQVWQLGEVPYLQAWAWQKQRVQALLQDPTLPDGLLLLTHPPVYTLGHGSNEAFLRFNPGQHELHRVERGGEATYHGPGQWVGYPILNLRRHRPDLHWYLRQLEQVLLEVLAELDLVGERIPGLTGVWVQGAKVGSIGIRATRWITYHGFALNVDPDLSAFERIVPCGIPDRPVGALAQWIPDIEMQDVGERIIQAFGRCFGLSIDFDGGTPMLP